MAKPALSWKPTGRHDMRVLKVRGASLGRGAEYCATPGTEAERAPHPEHQNTVVNVFHIISEGYVGDI